MAELYVIILAVARLDLLPGEATIPAGSVDPRASGPIFHGDVNHGGARVRILRWLGLFALIVLLALVALRFVPLDALREPLSRALSSAIGRPIRIDGDIRIEIDRDPHIEVERISLWDLPGRADLGRVELEFQLLPLLRGSFEVSEVVLVDGRVELEGRDESDSGEDAAAPRLPRNVTRAIALAPTRLRAREVTVVHTSRAGLVTSLELARLDFEAPEPMAPIAVRAAGRFNGREFDVVADLGTPAALAAGREPFPVAVSGEIDQMQLAAQGTIADPGELSGLDLSLSLAAPHLRAIRSFADRNLPEIGPVHAEARLTDVDGRLGFEGVRIQIGDAEDPVRVSAEGVLDDLDDLDEIAFQLKLEADDLPLIGELVGIPLPAVGHVSLSGSFRGSNELLASEGFSLGLDDTIVDGRISSGFVPGRRPTLKARLETARLELVDIGIREREKNPPRANAQGEVSLTEAPFRFDRLPEIDAHIEVRADQVVGRAELMIDAFQADFILDEQRIAIENLRIDFAGGSVRGEASVRVARQPPAVAVKLDGSGVHLERILAQVEREPSLSGLLDAKIDANSNGSSLRALRANVNGQLRFLIREGYARSSYANALQGDLLQAAFGARAPKQFDEVQCLLGDIRANRGIAEIATLWLETDVTQIRAEGGVDLRSDTFDLRVTPRPKRRGLFSFSADVTIKGPFSDPRVAPVPSTITRSAVAGLVKGVLRPTDPFLEPLTDPVLSRLFERRGGQTGPCAGIVPEDS